MPRAKNFQLEIKDSMPGFSHIYAPCQDALAFMLHAIYRDGSSTNEDGMMAN